MYHSFFRHPFMSARGLAACDAHTFVAAMCRIELALVQVQEDAGLLARGSAAAMARHLHADAFDTAALAEHTPDGGNVAIPFVKQARALLPPQLRGHFHHGATSQDIVDTALMLVLQPRLEHCLTLAAACRRGGAALMQRHADTPMIGRTLMQQARPITFGAKVANWLWGLIQAEKRMREATRHGLYVQFGGPVGVQSAFAEQGLDLMDALAEALGLATPALPWHSDRQPILALGDAMGALAVAAEKIALDISLLAQTEIAEVSEPAATGAGGSSSMPHKRNPVGCARIRAAARQIHSTVALLHNAGAQPLERGLGEWHAEWAPLLDAVLLLEGALETLQPLLTDLEVHTEAMQRNLAVTGGAMMASSATVLLTEILDAERAAALAREASTTAAREQRDYAEVLLSYPEVAAGVDANRLRAALDPRAHVGSSQAQVARLQELMQSL